MTYCPLCANFLWTSVSNLTIGKYPKAKRDIDYRTLEDTLTLVQETMGLKVPTPTILVNSSTLMSCHS